MAGTVTLSYHGRLAIIVLDRSEKLNAMTKDGMYMLSKHLRAADENNEVAISLLIGKGRFFSAGADVSVRRASPQDTPEVWRHQLKESTSSSLNITEAFYSHRKILVTALNGPVVGIMAALIAFSDFVYCVPQAYLLTPFSSLGLIAEGGSSLAFARRMGVAKANEALIAGKKITSEELTSCGFVNHVFDCGPGKDSKFLDCVLNHLDALMGPHLNASSMMQSKALIAAPLREQIDKQLVAELFGSLRRYSQGIPQKEFEKLRNKAKGHKL